MSQTAIMRLRRKIVEMAHKAKEGHIPSCLSVLDIIYVLYTDIMGPDDRFVLSKGHAAAALYVVLADRKIIPAEWLDHFCEPHAALQGHPENSTPGVACSTGSLGHGLPMACGMAYAKKIKGEAGHVYCLIGDGECHEGSVWEAMRLAREFCPDNLTIIVDLNEPEREEHARRLEAFVSQIWDIRDGHDHGQIRQALETPFPLVFAKTVKGKGIPEMEADPRAWHHRAIGLGEMLERMDG